MMKFVVKATHTTTGRAAVLIKIGITVTFLSHLAGPVWAPMVSFVGNCAWLWITFDGSGQVRKVEEDIEDEEKKL